MRIVGLDLQRYVIAYASRNLSVCGLQKRVRGRRWGDVSADLDIDGRDEWRPLESLYVNLVKS